jgi:DNA-directed RNA polymerase specialized sigma24 family protein
MTKIQRLQRTFHDKYNTIKRFIFFKTGTNEDLRQESFLATWTGLLKDPNATDGYLRTRIKWRVHEVYKNSASINTLYREREDIKLIPVDSPDSENEICFEYLTNNHQPLDDQVIAKVDTEKFLKSLDSNERKIVRYRLEGMTHLDVNRKLRISRQRYNEIKLGLRPKIVAHFSA